MRRIENVHVRRTTRSGFTLTELVVTATLLVAVMAIVAPLTVRSGRLWQDARHHEMALDELSNQLERLMALPPAQRQTALAELTPSDYLLQSLPTATISSETAQDGDGTRLVLHLSWDRYGHGASRQPRPLPITLVGWLDPMPIESRPSEESP